MHAADSSVKRWSKSKPSARKKATEAGRSSTGRLTKVRRDCDAMRDPLVGGVASEVWTAACARTHRRPRKGIRGPARALPPRAVPWKDGPMPEFSSYPHGTPSWVDLGSPDVDGSAR